MKPLTYLLTLFFLVSCGLDRPKICDYKHSFSQVVLETERSKCGKGVVIINNREDLDFIFKEICKVEKKFMLNKQGDIWHVNIYIDGLDHKLLSLTKTALGTYYFRDKHGTYSNDKLAKKLVDLTDVECD
ncbi:MAG: hypothetical protein IT220_03590 [Flavobacteriaceae bacterium]|nr:hypothetical protein [Flavobacteriaceae bacterium]